MTELHPAVLALLALTVGACLFAGWKGGAAERLATAIILANWAISIVGESLIPDYRGVGSLAVDAITAFGFLALTLLFGRPWLGIAMLIYAVQFALHAFYFVTERSPDDLLHATVNNLNYLGVLVCLVFGTIGAIRRRQAARAA